MNIRDLRKLIFMNSQYCTHYFVGNSTILAGILRNNGYLYPQKLDKPSLKELGREYRKYTTILNSVVAIEILLFIYLIVFPHFLQFLEGQFFVVVFSLCMLPLVVLYLTYVVANSFYEKYLANKFGTYRKTAFKPIVKYIEDEDFDEYEKTPRKSIYVALVLAIIFCGYILTPFLISDMNSGKNYGGAERLSNLYLKFVPISAEAYASRAYAKLEQKQYKEAIADFELANKYSMSDSFSPDIIGVKTYYMPYSDMLKEFDKNIAEEDEEGSRYLFRCEKAIYQLKNNKDTKAAYVELNQILTDFEHGKDVYFSPHLAYFMRGQARTRLGDWQGAKNDFAEARKMCPDCKYSYETNLIRKP